MSFITLFKKLAVAAAFAFTLPSAGYALAVVNTPPPIALPTVNGGVLDTEGFFADSFLQEYTFNLGAGLFMATLIDNATLHPFTSLLLEVQTSAGATLGSVSAPGSSGFFTFSVAAPGSFKAFVSGTPSAQLPPLSTYGFSITPVPEPEVWAMMLLGVGLVGFRLRQKSKKANAQRFA